MATATAEESEMNTVDGGGEESQPNASQTSCDNNSEDHNEGRHMALLRKAIEKTVDKCVSVGRFSLFAKNHPSITKKNTKALQTIHKQYQGKLREAIHNEVATIFQEEKIGHLMNELDRLIEEVPSEEENTTAWRPSGDPDRDLATHLVPVKLKQKERLEKIVSGLEEENARLMKAVLPRRHSLVETKRQMVEKCDKLRKTTENLPMDKVDAFLLEDLEVHCSQ